MSLFPVLILVINYKLSFRGVARIFQRWGGGGNRGYSPECHVDLHAVHARINQRQEPLTKLLYKKTNFKKVGFSTMAFTVKILSWRFRHLNIVGCLLKRRPTKGGHGHPRTPPPPPATPLLSFIFFEKNNFECNFKAGEDIPPMFVKQYFTAKQYFIAYRL